MIKFVIALSIIGIFKIFASVPCPPDSWEEAVRVIYLQRHLSPKTVAELVRVNEELRTANKEPSLWSVTVRSSIENNEFQIRTNESLVKAMQMFTEKKAPITFFTSQPKRDTCETDEIFRNRMLIPSLLCQVGWEGAFFLMASSVTLDRFFKNGVEVPLSLKKLEGKKCVQKRFGVLEEAAENGHLSAVLCLLSIRNRTESWQQDFLNGFFKYCQKNGYGQFGQYVLHHSDLFFDNAPRMHDRVKSWKAQCFTAALVGDLRKNRESFLETETEIVHFKTLSLTQVQVDELYEESAKLTKYGLMDHLLRHSSWPKPGVEAENFALDSVLNAYNYDRAKWMLTEKPGKKPGQKIVDSHVGKTASDGNWPHVELTLSEMYDTGLVPVSQELTDTLYVYAAAHANTKYLTLLTSEPWTHKPTQRAKDNAFVHACMNNHTKLMEIFAMENFSIEPEFLFGPFVSPFSVPEAFDQGLIETVKYRHKEMFELLLNVYADQLSEAGMKVALEQAGKSSQRRGSLEIEGKWHNNHYQELLKRKLGIKPSNPFLSLIKPIEFDMSLFQFAPAGDATILASVALPSSGGDGSS